MNLFSSRVIHAAGLALFFPLLGMCDHNVTVSFSGTTLTYGGSTSGLYTETATAGQDMFSVSVPYTASYNASGTFINFYPVVTALANTKTTDNVHVEFSETFTASDPSQTFYTTYVETLPYVLSSGVSASGYLKIDDKKLPTISFTGPGSYTDTESEAITHGLAAGTLTELYDITFNFAASSPSGTGGSSPAPEPAQMIPAALGLTGFGLVALRRRKKEPRL